MIDSANVFDAVRRGYNEFQFSSDSDIVDYFSSIDAESIGGHVNNIKGILFELEYTEQLDAQGIDANIFSETNHPITDIYIMEDGEVINEMQLKATDSVSYIEETLQEHPDVEIVATSEVAAEVNSDMVIDSGIENSVLEDTVFDELINPISGLSILGFIFGFGF